MYVDYEYYDALYGDDGAPESSFNLHAWDVCRKLDLATTGHDGVQKLRQAFPTDENAVECVKRCACALIQNAYGLEQAEKNARMAQGYTLREDGSLQGRVISSISAGNESISYSTSSNSTATTLTDKALASQTIREQVERNIITTYLSGVTDANGVPLLYMGPYPYVR